eukprot:scaffold403740_cov15-Prasinocladus_malaysianus.AAC.1
MACAVEFDSKSTYYGCHGPYTHIDDLSITARYTLSRGHKQDYTCAADDDENDTNTNMCAVLVVDDGGGGAK